MTEQTYARLTAAIETQLRTDQRILVAIDGRCGSGKTSLAARLQETFGCEVFHMDDFFLQPHQRTAERLAQPGENVDHERFLAQVLLPLRRGDRLVTYRPFVCSQQDFGAAIQTTVGALSIIDGSYSCHPALWDFYDLRVFLTVPAEEQMRRIEQRGGAEKARQFAQRWIPLEEYYFSAFDLSTRCDLLLEG